MNFDKEMSYSNNEDTWFVQKALGAKQRRKKRRRAILLTNHDGKIQFVYPAARRWLKKFFGRSQRATLPRKVSQWISTHRRSGQHISLLGRKGKTQLYIRREHSYIEDSVVLLLELIKGKSDERSRRHRNLTPREREVLFWLGGGKSNAEIGAILGIQPSTVGKHLEHIYPKLGVENRTAAASFASELRFGEH